MAICVKNFVSITEASENFSCVAQLVDKKGAVVILKNDVPQYVLMKCAEAEANKYASDKEVMAASKRLIEKNLEDYKELAK